MQMQAILLDAPGAGQPGALQAVTIDRPSAEKGEIIMRVAYCGCNFADTMMWRGTYPHPRGYPFIPGFEVAGTVAEVGDGVKEFSVGDRVVGYAEAGGGFAEFCRLPATTAFHMPDDVGTDTAAAALVQALTAWHLLHTVSQVRAQEVVLVHAIGGGVGLYFTQLAHEAGARVIGTVGTSGKEKRALEFGAEMVVDRSQADFTTAIRQHLAGGSVDRIYDSTGATILEQSFSLLSPLGQVVSFGEAEGRPLDTLWMRLVEKSLTFTRFHLGHIDPASDTWARGTAAIFERVASGALRVPIERVFSFREARQMFESLASRRISGKLLLAVAPEQSPMTYGEEHHAQL